MKTLSLLLLGGCLIATLLFGFWLRGTLTHAALRTARSDTPPARQRSAGAATLPPRVVVGNRRTPHITVSEPPGPTSWDVFLKEVAALAEASPAEAERLALALDGPQRDEALAVLAVAFARSDTSRSLRMAEMIEEPQQRTHALGFALAQHAKADPDAVFARLAGGEESEELRAQLETCALAALADLHPERVVDWLSENKGTAAAQMKVLCTTVQRWAQKDPKAAAAWVAGFDDQQLLPSSVIPLVTTWTGYDPAASAAWIESLPEGTLRDQAVAAYALTGAAADPEKARQWALTIQSDELKTSTMRQLDAAR